METGDRRRVLTEEFMDPLGLTPGALAKAIGVQRKHVNELFNGKQAATAATALILADVFGNSPEFGSTRGGGPTFGKSSTHHVRERARI